MVESAHPHGLFHYGALMPDTRTVVRAKACEIFPAPGLRVVKLGGEFQLAPRLAS